MRSNFPFPKLTESGSLSRLFVLSLLLQVGTLLAAAELYLAPGKPDGIALLPPPPVPGSEEEKADLAEAQAVFHGRTTAEEARALKDAKLSFDIFESAIGPAFDLRRLPKTAVLLHNVRKDIAQATDTPKEHFKRKRPYELDPQLSLGEREPSFGYPSGHSTRGTVYSLVLAELFPDKREAIYTIGRQIGWDRVLLGKHFPTDIYAGRVLGRAIVREMRSSPAFLHDLAEAKAELKAAEPLLASPAEKN
jgi:acid phosphatase (class A)